METSLGQYVSVFLPGEPPSLTVKPGQPQSTESRRVGHYQRDSVPIGPRHFFACGSSASGRVESEGGTAAWLVGTLVVSSVQGHGLPPPQELWLYQSLFEPLVAGNQKASLASLSPESACSGTQRGSLPGVLLCCSVHQAHRGPPPPAGVLLCSSVHQSFDGPASLLLSCQCWCVWGERLW